MVILTRGANLLSLVDLEALLAELREIIAQAGMPLVLVVFDTLSRSMPGGDENKSEDMTTVIGAADAIRDEFGATCAVVHHSGKDSDLGARGHSSLFGAADTVINVAKRTATIVKTRDGVAGENFPFELEVVQLGKDSDGDPVTTCVVRHVQQTAAVRHRPEPTGKNQKVVYDVLRELVIERGALLPETSAIPLGTRAVTFEALFDRAAHKFPGTVAWRARDRISQALVGLQAGHHVGVHGGYVWLAS